MPFDGQTYIKPDTHLADILRRAWKKIEQDGWRKCGKHSQGSWTSSCALVAVYDAGEHSHESYLAARLLDKAVPPAFATHPTPTAAYNDDPDTTLADMRALFLRAIDLVGG